MSSSRGRKRDRRRPAGLEPGADQSSPARGTKQKTARRAIWAAGLFLVGLTVLAYAPAIHNGYIWDDDYYVTENQTLRSFQGLGRIWCELGAVPQYYPLVHTSYWLEYRLWGLNPVGYHVVNILLHAVCALLAWRVLVLLEVPGAWVAAAVFALHPINVESAAWITERKNVLSGVFYMAAALAYLRYALVPGPAADRRARVRWYVAALAFFIFALFGKTVTGSLPAAILLVLWWKAGRVRPRDVWPLAPFFVAALAMGSLTAWMERQHVGAIGHEWDFSWLDRCLIAGRSLWFYVGKLVWPVDLTFIYPRWRIDASVWWQYLYPAAALAVIVGLWLARGRVGRGPLTAVLFFTGTLVPALGFFNVYPMRYSFVADHFQYLAGLGPIVLAVSAVVLLADRLGVRPKTPVAQASSVARASACACPHADRRTRTDRHADRSRPCDSRVSGGTLMPARSLPPAAIAGCVLIVLGVLTWRQTRVYAGLETLWLDTLRKNPDAWLAHNNLGTILQKRGRLDEAMTHYLTALRLKSDDGKVHNNLAGAYNEFGRLDEAMAHARRSLQLEPLHADTHRNMGLLLSRTGDFAGAAEHYRFVVRVRPSDSQACNNLAWLLATAPDDAVRDAAEAVRLAERAVELSGRRDPTILDTLAAACASAGRYDHAVTVIREALAMIPDSTPHADSAPNPLAADFRTRLDLYLQGRPYREPPPATRPARTPPRTTQ